MNDYLILTKARITGLVLVTTTVGFVLASSQSIDWGRLAVLLVGVALATGGSAALNQYLEHEIDARMRRTESRPLPAGRMGRRHGLAVGVLLSALGVIWLLVRINPLTGLLALVSSLLYLMVYTPLKTRTPLNTLVGAVPGAIPPVMGWTAVTGRIDVAAWALFGILYLWQFPHFLAIAWMYRDDYARARLPMLPVVDPDGGSTGRQVALYSLALLPVSLIPTVLGLAGSVYFFGALVAGLIFLGFGLAMTVNRERASARRLLLASVTYLPILLALLLVDRAGGP
ncbi:MAG: heme o synthase [Gemmatimonadota bacterium]